ncbi:hypothetical protein [Senegalia massiliensis]|nr:hypothetical protein [Senegalia massiliensis]
MLELYNNQEELLNIQINSLKIIKQRIHSKRRNIEQALLCGNDFLIESVKEEYLFCSDEIFNINDFEMTYVFGNLIKTSAEKLLPNIYGMISKTDNAVKDIVPLRFYIHTTLKSDNSMIVKPSGKYLTTFHTGDYSTLQTTYKKVLSYAEKHNIILYEWFYTETIIGDWAVCSPQEYIIKVSIQINENI